MAADKPAGICPEALLSTALFPGLMEEKDLLKIALTVSIIGVAALLLVSQNIKAEASTLEKDASVSVQGTITQVSHGKNTTFLTISRQESLSVVIFSNVNLNAGDNVSIEGAMQDYKGNTELVAEKITLATPRKEQTQQQ